MAQTAKRVQLKPQTVKAVEAHIRKAEAGMEQALRGRGPFLWSDLTPERAQAVRDGQVVADRPVTRRRVASEELAALPPAAEAV